MRKKKKERKKVHNKCNALEPSQNHHHPPKICFSHETCPWCQRVGNHCRVRVLPERPSVGQHPRVLSRGEWPESSWAGALVWLKAAQTAVLGAAPLHTACIAILT